MAKCGIITLFGEYNFGNRLQNYASQEVLKKLNFEVETIKYIGLLDDVASTDTDIAKGRLEKFKEFNKNIDFHDEVVYRELDTHEKFHEKFDYFVIGSDQIWNFTFDTIFSEKAFASFSPKHKNVSIAASFGVDFLPEEGTPEFDICKKHLNEIKHISVREEAGKRMVEELTDRDDVFVMIDPTMLLRAYEWEKVMKKPEKLKTNKYILKSFLGDTDGETTRSLERIAKENDCEIIDISDKNSYYYDMGPAEFLYLEKNAFLVVTDSFHSCVFSIIFNTPFLVFERKGGTLKSMYSRIETLLSTFKLENRIYTDKITNDELVYNYDEADKILEDKRKEAYDFLKKALIYEE